MYIIISHDVDHLYTIEHWKKDLILEKLPSNKHEKVIEYDSD